MKGKEERFFLVDAIRGVAIVNMVLFHFLYDVFIVYNVRPTWYSQYSVHIWQQAICWTFIFISGFVWKWGERKNLQRGIFLNCCGMLISLITWRIIPSEAIWFGILNFIGCSVLILIPLDKYLKRIPPLCGFGICFLLFGLFKNIQNGFLGIDKRELIQLPTGLYDIKILTPLEFPFPGFVSSDYFPILPWLFLYLAGYFFSRVFLKKIKWKVAAQCKIPILTAMGQKSIWVYLLHQPVSMLICILVHIIFA